MTPPPPKKEKKRKEKKSRMSIILFHCQLFRLHLYFHANMYDCCIQQQKNVLQLFSFQKMRKTIFARVKLNVLEEKKTDNSNERKQKIIEANICMIALNKNKQIFAAFSLQKIIKTIFARLRLNVLDKNYFK